MRASMLPGVLLVLDQGYGWGYRYLNGLMPCFCLLAAAGWRALGDRFERPLPTRLLWAAAAGATLATVPVALWTAHGILRPYAAAYAAARGSGARYVLVDTRASVYLQDVVRLDGPPRPPFLMDLGKVPERGLDRLCRSGSVAVLDRRAARALGVPGWDLGPGDDGPEVYRRRHLHAIGCGRVL